MVIDSHQHFWKYDPVTHGWIDDSMAKIRRDFTPTDLQPILETNGIDGCIAVQADQTESETEYLLDCAKEHHFIKGVVGWVDLMATNVEARLAYFAQHESLKGIRHIVQSEPNDFMLRPEFQSGIAKLSQFGLTYDILIYPQRLDAAIALVQKYPDQQFVLDHIAKPSISKGMDKAWKSKIKALGELENLYCKVSGMVTETEEFRWNVDDFKVFLDVVTQAFGVDRLMYGSDWPVCLVAASYKEVLSIIKNYFADEELANIMGLNACKFYHLEQSGG